MKYSNVVSVVVNFSSSPTPILVTILTVIFAGLGVRNGCLANQKSDTAIQTAREANTISIGAKDEAAKANSIAQRQVELSHLTPLFVLPVAFEPYIADGNHKAKITVLVANTSQADYATEVNVNFIIDDGTGRKVSSRSWNELMGDEEIITVLAPGVRGLYSWSPDVPAKEFYANGQYIFKLTTEVSWKSVAGKCYKFSDYSQLSNSQSADRFHFDTKRQGFSETDCENSGSS